MHAQLHFERMVMSRATGEAFIPSKSCLLTRVLVDACGGNSKTALLVFLSPKREDSKMTMHAIQFAQSARSIRNKSKPNVYSDLSSLRAVFHAAASPSPLATRRLDDSASTSMGADRDDPWVMNWLQLKP
jgi:hypothetical protein